MHTRKGIISRVVSHLDEKALIRYSCAVKLKGVYSWIYISHLRRASVLKWSKEKKKNADHKQHPHQDGKKTKAVLLCSGDRWPKNLDRPHKIHPNNPNELFTKHLSPFQNWKSLLLLTILVPLMFRMEKKIF